MPSIALSICSEKQALFNINSDIVNDSESSSTHKTLLIIGLSSISCRVNISAKRMVQFFEKFCTKNSKNTLKKLYTLPQIHANFNCKIGKICQISHFFPHQTPSPSFWDRFPTTQFVYPTITTKHPESLRSAPK